MVSIDETVTLSRVGEDGRLKLFSAFQLMQDCSEMWIDSETALKAFFRERNVAQLLISRQVDVLRVPSINEKLTTTTSVYGCLGLEGFRNTIIRDGQGRPCYATWAMGAFVNLDTGRMCRVPPETSATMVFDPQYEMEYLPRKIALPNGEYREHFPVEVKRNDIDYNLHMNNAQYVRVACEYLPEGFEIKRMRVEYKIPAKRGEMIHPQTIGGEDGRFYVLLKNGQGKNYAVMEFWR